MEGQLRDGLRHHFFEDDLEGDGVAAAPAGQEELAVAMPLAIFQFDVMGVVGAVETGGE